MKTILRSTLTIMLSLVLALGFSACESTTDDDDTGTLSVTMTDAPFPTDLVAEANVTITELEAREKDVEDTHSPFLTLSDSTQTFNLLDLRNGVTTSLANLDVPVGTYDMFRLYVSAGEIILKDGTTYNLTVPSGAQTGIQLLVSPAIEVVGGLTADLLLDFDVEKSFVPKGPRTDLTGFNFKPVIRAVNASVVGSLAGRVTDALDVGLGDARVWVSQDTVFSTTYTDTTTGEYTILGLDPGSYTASATLEGYDTLSVEIEIVVGNETTRDFELTPQ
ncbi:MAG: DUF4382 domain-containing protein [Fidelibacterota bacterium]|nr:MAG: DUF4382 domain-containing protein [Candidatus Neomarinimicrobiota bacterium]